MAEILDVLMDYGSFIFTLGIILMAIFSFIAGFNKAHTMISISRAMILRAYVVLITIPFALLISDWQKKVLFFCVVLITQYVFSFQWKRVTRLQFARGLIRAFALTTLVPGSVVLYESLNMDTGGDGWAGLGKVAGIIAGAYYFFLSIASIVYYVFLHFTVKDDTKAYAASIQGPN